MRQTRMRFEAIDEPAEWYKHRIHGGLWLKMGETPEEILFRKTRKRPCRSLYGTNRTEERGRTQINEKITVLYNRAK